MVNVKFDIVVCGCAPFCVFSDIGFGLRHKMLIIGVNLVSLERLV